MAKLHLKRTPAEEAERALHKARKALRKARKKHWYDSHLDEDIHSPSSSSHKPDYNAILAELEDARFRDKMWDALQDDEWLDGIDARFNDYAHVPNRWRTNTPAGTSSADQTNMDDEEYAECIRQGMWRRMHARQHEEEGRRKEEQAARRARQKELEAEAARLEKAAKERRSQKKRQKERQREEHAQAEYDRRWKDILDPNVHAHGPLLSFGDIPWPSYAHMMHSDTDSESSSVTLEQLTTTTISAFLIPDPTNSAAQDAGVVKEKKERLREALRRFHPDKFEGRVMRKVIETDRCRAREAVGQVARVLNILMEDV